jgi:hypothetical protein
MDNNLTDINYNLKTIIKTSTDDDNDKAVKIIQTQPQTHTMNCASTSSGNTYLLHPSYSITINAYNTFLTSINITASSSGSTMTVRVWLIDENYDEIITDVSFTSSNTTINIAGNYRCVNDMQIISGALNSGLTLSAFPNGLAAAYEQVRLLGNNSAKYNCRYMCPRGKRVKLSSIDYYRCVNSTPTNLTSDLSLQIFLRGVDANVSNSLFNYAQVISPFNRTYNANGVYSLEYGDSILFYRIATTGAVNTSLSATLTIYDDIVY